MIFKELGKLSLYVRNKGSELKIHCKNQGVSTVYQKHSILPTRKWKYRMWRLSDDSILNQLVILS